MFHITTEPETMLTRVFPHPASNSRILSVASLYREGNIGVEV